MKTLVSIPDDVLSEVKNHKLKYYKDLTIPKMLVRLAIEDIQRKETESK